MNRVTRILSLVPSGNGAHVVHTLLDQNIPYYHVSSYNPWWTIFPPVLSYFSRRLKSDLIHTPPDYAIWSKNSGTPLIVTFHGYVLDRFMRCYSSQLQYLHYRTDLRLYTWLAAKWAHRVTAVSHFTASMVRDDLRIERPIRVIYNGIDETRFIPASQRENSPIRVLFSGKLTRSKGAHWLLPIAKRLNKGIEILYTQGLRTRRRLPDHPNLRCVGQVPYESMPDLYRKVDILLFPTVREGFGLAAAEAMACGLPVVATNCSSLPELINEGKGGYLCPLGDVDDFADKINGLADSPEQRKEMGQYNRHKVEEHFTLQRMIMEYRQLFQEVLEGGR